MDTDNRSAIHRFGAGPGYDIFPARKPGASRVLNCWTISLKRSGAYQIFFKVRSKRQQL